jgi:hypothetical protein
MKEEKPLPIIAFEITFYASDGSKREVISYVNDPRNIYVNPTEVVLEGIAAVLVAEKPEDYIEEDEADFTKRMDRLFHQKIPIPSKTRRKPKAKTKR